jgi:hypothetical protein
MGESPERGKNRLLWLDASFERCIVTDDPAQSMVKPISGDLSLSPHPLRSRHPPRSHLCNVHDASQATHGLSLHNRHRVWRDGGKLVQFAADCDHLLAGEKRHQIQEVNPKFQKCPALAWYPWLKLGAGFRFISNRPASSAAVTIARASRPVGANGFSIRMGFLAFTASKQIS